MYQVVAERKVEKQLRGLLPDVFEAVVAAVRALANDPRPPNCRKLQGTEWTYNIQNSP